MKPLCLVGMSGVGKSFWSQRLVRDAGFVRHDCDGAIGEQLASLVSPAPGESTVNALGRWMGMPWSAGYDAREARYLELEHQVTRDALEAAAGAVSADPARHVIDSTGSVVYLPASLLDDLRARCHVVYLRTPESRLDAMLARYLGEPKPVVWGGAFPPGPGRSPRDALPAAYRALLAHRHARYAALASTSLDGGLLEATSPGAHAFLAACAAG